MNMRSESQNTRASVRPIWQEAHVDAIAAVSASDAASARDSLSCLTHALSHRAAQGFVSWHATDDRTAVAQSRSIAARETHGEERLALQDASGEGPVQLALSGFCHRRDCPPNGTIRHAERDLRSRATIRELYERRGPDCVSELDGEFAFVLWDPRNHTLLAARDRFGTRPLYFSESTAGLALASEAKALLALEEQPRWNREQLFKAFALGCDAHASLFSSVRQLLPGNCLVKTGGPLQVSQHSDIVFPEQSAAAGITTSNRRWDFELREALTAAIGNSVARDERIGCFLGGGIDSAAVIAITARLFSGTSTAFTGTFEHPLYDEGPIARETARFCSSEFHALPLSDSALADHAAEAVWLSETLGQNPADAGWLLLSRAARGAGIHEVLCGLGADELLGGYVFHRYDYLQHSPTAARLPNNAALLADLLGKHPSHRAALQRSDSPELNGVAARLGFAPSWMRALALTSRPRIALLAPQLRAEFASLDPFVALCEQTQIRDGLRGRDPAHQSMYLWIKLMLSNFALHCERLTAAGGVSIRFPFLDACVVDCGRAMPLPLLFGVNPEKSVLRTAMRNEVPQRVLARRQWPMMASHTIFDTGKPMRELVHDTLHGSDLRAMEALDRHAVLKLLGTRQNLPIAARPAVDQALFMALSACLLQKKLRLC